MILAALPASGCGGGSSAGGSNQPTAASSPAPPKSEFPQTEGRNLREIVKGSDGHAELIVEPQAEVFYTGENRFPFAVLHPDRTPVSDAKVALYVAKVPPEKGTGRGVGKNGKQKKGALARARTEALEQPATGPFPAAIESLATKPAFRSMTTAEDPEAATVVYGSTVDFTSDGEWRIAALIKQGDETVATLLPSVEVGEFKRVPRVGQRPPRIHTPTAAEVGGDLSKLTTRVPPDTQNQVDFAGALGREPVLLLFATPQFCQSRACGPVVDVAEQVKHRFGDRAAFIHMEIYNHNDPSKGVTPQVRAFHLPTEPWLFAIDRSGVIKAEVEGAFGVRRMTEVVEDVIGE